MQVLSKRVSSGGTTLIMIPFFGTLWVMRTLTKSPTFIDDFQFAKSKALSTVENDTSGFQGHEIKLFNLYD
jgi:hypothetical protein